jgi:hypothetical protein
MPIPLRMPGPGPPPVRSAMPQPVSYGGTATFQAAVVSLDGSRWECFSPTSENIRSKSGRGSKLNLGSSDSGGCPGGATCNLKKWQQLPCKIRAWCYLRRCQWGNENSTRFTERNLRCTGWRWGWWSPGKLVWSCQDHCKGFAPCTRRFELHCLTSCNQWQGKITHL